MSEESARNGSWHAKSGRQTAIFGRTPILNAILVSPLNKKNKKCVVVVLMQTL